MVIKQLIDKLILSGFEVQYIEKTECHGCRLVIKNKNILGRVAAMRTLDGIMKCYVDQINEEDPDFALIFD